MSGLRVASLFCGIGGIDLMFEKAGHSVVWANDKDKYACMTYRHNFPHVSLVEGDIREIDKASIPDFDILAAGFPCQPFSVCGKQKGFSDPRGNVFFEIGKTIDAKRPSIVFLENVANLTEHNGGRTFNVIHKELAGRNYFLRYLVADACDYADIPQHRTRTYLLAFRDEKQCRKFVFPEKKPLTRQITDVIDTTKKMEESLYLHSGDYGYDKMVAAIRDDKQLYRFSDYGIQSSKDGIAFTKDKFGIRRITPMECLALQGFPLSFLFPSTVPLREQYKQAGNTVCIYKS